MASLVEGGLTALVVAFLQRTNPAILEAADKSEEISAGSSFQKLRWLWIGAGVLVIASPLSLLGPGTAWGEWGTGELAKIGLAGIPSGLERLSGLWGAPLAGYDLPALGNVNLGYVLSAALGILVIGLVAWLFTRLLTARSPAPKQQQ